MGNTDRPLTDIVARRELDIKDSTQKVVVELGRPYASGNAFACTYRIAYEPVVIQREIFGLDAFQALQLALQIVSVHLHHDKDLPVGKMYWLDPDSDLGFPTPEVEE